MPTDWKAMASHYRNSIGRTRLCLAIEHKRRFTDTVGVINSASICFFAKNTANENNAKLLKKTMIPFIVLNQASLNSIFLFKIKKFLFQIRVFDARR